MNAIIAMERMQKEIEKVQKENAALKQRLQDFEAEVTSASGGGSASASV